MSYLVLARKYRPKSFEQMVGQEHVVQALTNALTQERLHHAYLFTGTRGVGKTTVSRILAKSLNCTGPDGAGGITARPCGVCDACTEIDAGRHVDYTELDAASNRGVDEMAQLLEQAVYKPVLGRFKVYMIDEVHMLTGHAFNAMLKTLEEPPEYLKFVLATTDPQKVPVTVLSRCLQFNLRPLGARTIAGQLAHVLDAEGVAHDATSLNLLARAARGSMRDALSLADQAIAYGAGRLSEAQVRQMLGAVDRGQAARIVQALAEGDGKAAFDAVEQLRSLGLSAAGTLEEIAALAQQIALAQVVPDVVDADDPESATAIALAGRLAADETQLLYSLALHGREELALAPDEYAGLTMVLLRFLAFKPGAASQRPDAVAGSKGHEAKVVAAALTHPVTERAVRQEPVELEAAQKPSMAPEPATARPPAREASSAPADVEEAPPGPAGVALPGGQAPAGPTPAPTPAPSALDDRWADYVATLIERGDLPPLARELAMQSQCLAMDGDAWRLRAESDALRGQCTKLQHAIAASLGRSITLEVEAGAAADSPARREAAERARRQREAERRIEGDPLVREMLSRYKTARIVPGSVRPI